MKQTIETHGMIGGRMRREARLPKFVSADRDRHGNVRLYYRRKDQSKVRLPDDSGSADFHAAYAAALSGQISAPTRKREPSPQGSLRSLCQAYYKSANFLAMLPRSQRVRRAILERFCSNKGDGDRLYRDLKTPHILKLRDELADRPEAANSLVKALRTLFSFAIEYGLAEANPARDVRNLRSNPDGIHSWTIEEIQQFEERHPIGTKARLALALALYTGQRRSDIVLLGRQHVRDGSIILTQQKNRAKSPVRLEIPIVPQLRAIIAASPTGDLTYLVTEFNRPFTANGFGNRFRKWCIDAGLQHCSAHGLRKAAAARLAELGCSELEIMAITGHRTSKEVTRYTRAASQKLRAVSATNALSAGGYENQNVPLFEDDAASGTISTPKAQ